MNAVFAMMAQDQFGEVRSQVERMSRFADACVVVDNGSSDGSREWLAQQDRVVFVARSWNDSFVQGRNAYLTAIGDIAEQSDEPLWIWVADPDETYSDGLLEDLRALCQEAYENDYNILRVRCRSVETDWKGEVVWSHLDEWHKPLCILWEPNLRYRGIGNSEVHEDLVIPSGRREATLPDDGGRLIYEHRKRHGEIWLRGIRNFFAGGGGPNLGEANPLWRPFRGLVKKVAGATTAAEFVKYLQAGQAHPAILDWFRSRRLLGTKFDDTPPMWPQWPDGTSEVREGFLAYHIYLHPSTMPPELVVADRAYCDYRSEVKVIHGPNAPAWAT